MGLFFRWLVGAPLYVKYVCREIIVPLGIPQAVARKTQFLGALLQMVGHAVSPPADEIRDAAVGAWRMPPKIVAVIAGFNHGRNFCTGAELAVVGQKGRLCYI